MWKEEKIKMQNEIALLRTNNSMLKTSVETLSKNLEEAKVDCQFIIKIGTTEKNHSKTLLGVKDCVTQFQKCQICRKTALRVGKKILSHSVANTQTVESVFPWHQSILLRLCVLVKEEKNQ